MSRFNVAGNHDPYDLITTRPFQILDDSEGVLQRAEVGDFVGSVQGFPYIIDRVPYFDTCRNGHQPCPHDYHSLSHLVSKRDCLQKQYAGGNVSIPIVLIAATRVRRRQCAD